jgi:thiopeptide-type bacteriocin biosynthesis protein
MPSRTAPPPVSPAAALLRVSTSPGGFDLPEDLGRPDADAAGWLALIWQREDIRTAIAIASPALAGQVSALVTAARPDAGRARRAASALACYLMRWQGRATPFGLFAGVGVARSNGHARASLGATRAVARADAAWLGDVTARLHQCGELMERLPVVASDAIIVRGGRLVVPGHPSGRAAGELAPVEVSVRCSRPVRAAVEAARKPIPLGKLARQLYAGFPAATRAQVDELLDGLIAHGVLVSSLYAPMTCPDALGHVCARLREARAEEIPAISGLASELAAVHQAIESATDGPVLLAVAARMTALSQAAEMPLAVEVAVDCDVQVPEQVAREARNAAIVLHRVSPYPAGLPAWTSYHQRCVDRYGTGALVPVLELVADSGLGLPAGYLGAALERPARTMAQRDTVLLGLVQKAMADGSGEVVLTDEVITGLAGGTWPEIRLPARAEIAFEVRAASLEALDQGRFTLVVSGAPRPGSSMIGRHAHVLDGAGRDELAGTFAVAPDGAIAAQLSFAPRRRRDENVARTMRLLPDVIGIGEHRDDDGRVLALGDLAVSADASGLVLVHMPTGRLVEPRVAHALEAGVHTPPLARFLSEVSTARCAAYCSFDFGAASRLPYLPRIRYRRAILSPARWLLAAGDLPGPGAAMAEWEAAFGTWRQRWRVPRHVAVTDHDRRLPLDLDHAFHRELLRSRLRRAGQLELRESATPGELGWIGRAHQVVLPVALDAAAPQRAATAPPLVREGMGAIGSGPVRSMVLTVLAFGHPDRFDEILAGHLPSLAAAVGGHAAAWWFRRQAGTGQEGPHVAVSLLLPDPGALGPAASEAAAWADRLRRERLLSQLALTVDDPQARTPGWGPATCRVLTADSAAAIAQIALTQRAGTDPAAVAAASMADLAASLAPSPAEGASWLARVLPREHGPVDRALREQALRLTNPAFPIAEMPGGANVAAAWKHRAEALSSYRQHLAGRGGPEAMLRFLLSEHQARVLDSDGPAGRVARHLARACALRSLATRPEGPGAPGAVACGEGPPARREHG